MRPPTAPASSGPHPVLPARRPRRHLAVVAAALVALALVATTPAYAGGSTAGAAGAAGGKPGGATRITSWVLPTSVATEAAVTTSLVVAGPGSDQGRTVVVQALLGGSWAVVKRGTTDHGGRARLTWPTAAGDAGVYSLRVVVTRAGARKGATSPTRTMAVIDDEPTTTPAPSPTPAPTEPTDPAPPADEPTGTPDPYLAETLRLVNEARATARSCGSQAYAAVPPLAAEARLARSADGWARRMGAERFFAHEHDGSTPSARITAAGYRWSAWGENIAAGYRTPAATVAGWLHSEGHCKAIMNPTYTQVGVGYAVTEGSPYGDYWVLNFGRPR